MHGRPLRVTVDFGGLDPEDDEFGSIEDFIEFLVDDERGQFDWRHLNCLAYRLGISNRQLRRELETWGFTLAPREKPNQHRGFRTNSHDRWDGPGSSPTHGGSGWLEITGFASPEGD